MLRPQTLQAIPADTARVAKAAFKKGTTVMRLRDLFGTLFCDEDFASLFPPVGQPALAPWRLALVTIFQFLENLTDTPCGAQADKLLTRSGGVWIGNTRSAWSSKTPGSTSQC